MRTPVGWKVRDVRAKQPDRSGIGAQVAADLVKQRGLASAVRPDNQPALASLDAKSNVLRDGQTAEGFSQVDDVEGWIGCRCDHGPLVRHLEVSRSTPGTIPLGITRTMKRNTSPKSMFHRSI